MTDMLRWENPSAGRYYQAMLQRNLFGELEMLRVWGRIGQAQGQQRWMPINGPDAGAKALAKIAAHRAKRGYLVSLHTQISQRTK
jgi:predicted DNA-binding WGR domain protein